MYFAARRANQVKRVDPSGQVTTVAGSSRPRATCAEALGCPGFGGDGGPAVDAQLLNPAAVALDPRGNLYVLDAGSARVRFVNLGSGEVTVHGVRVPPGVIQTVAGSGRPGGTGDGGQALDAQLTGSGSYVGLLGIAGGQELNSQPVLPTMAVDGRGNLFIADGDNHRVRRVDASGIITAFAGRGAAGPAASCCADPYGLALDAAGNLYVSDRSGAPIKDSLATRPRVWVINRGSRATTILGRPVEPGAVAPVAGNGSPGLAADGGVAVDGPLLPPAGITVDRRGNLYIAELGSVGGPTLADIRKVDSTGRISTLVGSGQRGFNGDGLRGPFTSLDYVAGIAMDHCGNLLIADLGNDRLRRLDLVPPCAAVATANPLGGPTSEGGHSLVVGATVILLVMAGGVFVLWRRSAH